MSAVPEQIAYTPEDLLTLPDVEGYELVDGQLVEKPMGFRASRVGGRLYTRLYLFSEEHQLGWVLPADTSYQCFPDAPKKVRKPDVSFIRAERLPADDEPEGHCPLAPDLAVEVVSPNDVFKDISSKVGEYLAAGVRLVWVIDPVLQRVLVYRADGSGSILNASDDLSGEDVVPGFVVRIGELFRPPTGVEKG
jgi:Uma2 family endonuclease